MSNLGFEQMLAQYHATLKQVYDEAEEFSDWMPPDSDEQGYIVTMVKCSKGVSTKKDANNPMFWWKPIVRIEAVTDELLNGREFALGFFNTNAPGIMKGQAKAINGGEPVAFDQLDSVFSEVGKVLRVVVKTTTSAKNNKEYTNCYVQEVIDTTDVADKDVDPAADQPVE